MVGALAGLDSHFARAHRSLYHPPHVITRSVSPALVLRAILLVPWAWVRHLGERQEGDGRVVPVPFDLQPPVAAPTPWGQQ